MGKYCIKNKKQVYLQDLKGSRCVTEGVSYGLCGYQLRGQLWKEVTKPNFARAVLRPPVITYWIVYEMMDWNNFSYLTIWRIYVYTSTLTGRKFDLNSLY